MSERVYAGRTPEERRDERRARLLDAGLEVFAAQGWHAAKVAGVCRAAGVGPRYFYEHFAGKEELFLAVGDRIAAQVEEVVRRAATAPGETADERVRGVLAALAGFFTEDPRTVRVALVESFATPALRAHRARLLQTIADLAARLMRSLLAEPQAADRRSLELSALVLSGGVAEALVAGVSGAAPATADELVEHLARLYAAAAQLSSSSQSPLRSQ